VEIIPRNDWDKSRNSVLWTGEHEEMLVVDSWNYKIRIGQNFKKISNHSVNWGNNHHKNMGNGFNIENVEPLRLGPSGTIQT